MRAALAIAVVASWCALSAAPAAAVIGEPCTDDCPVDNLAPSVDLAVTNDEPVRGQSVTFTATATDPDGDPIEYDWDLDGNGTYGQGGNTSQVSQSYSTLGDKTVQVRVSDGHRVATDSITIEVVNRAPTASFSRNPTSPQTGQTVTFTSTASDPDGDAITTMQWDLDNDTVFGEAGETGASVSRSYATAGTYPVKLRVTDSNGAASNVASLDLSVSNRAPTASFTASPSSPLSGEQVTFDSALSSDVDGTIAARAWDLNDDDVFAEGTGTVAQTTFALPGTYTVTLRVTDNNGATAELERDVTVGNRLPLAVFTSSPAAPLSGQDVTFDSTGSSDAEGAISREWDLDDGEAFDDGSGATATRQFPAAGNYTVRLKVTDEHGGTNVVEHTVAVANRAPTAVISADVSSPLTAQLVTFGASGSTDPDGTIESHEWDLDDGTAFDDGDGATATRHFPVAGEYTVRLRVTDNSGDQAVTTLTVTARNRAPSAAFSASPAGALAGDSVQFDGSASSDPEELALTKYEWDFDGNGTYDADSGTEAVTSHAYETPGTYTARLRVTDASGAQSVATRTLTVLARPGTAVTSTTGDSGNPGDPVSPGGGGGSGGAASTITGPGSLKLKVDRKGRFKLKGVGVTCPAGCVVKIAAKSGKKTLAKLTFTGSRQALRMKLSKKGRKLLKRKGKASLKIAVIVTPASGAPVTKTLKVALRR